MTWATLGPQTNPLQGAVLADTGALQTDRAAGACDLFCLVSSTVAARLILERRNAANDATIFSQDFALPGQNGYNLHIWNTKMARDSES